jgi:predicted nucleotidyltransferase
MSTTDDSNLLSATLFSRNRRAVLGLLYGHPDQEFYLRQIVRAAGGGHGAVQREIQQLSNAGIVRRTVRGSQVYFQANSACPIFEELKTIIVKTAGAADVLRTALAPLGDRIRIAFVYGSMARGQQKSLSDVDVLVVGDVEFREVVAAFAEAQSRLGREINPTVYTPDEFCVKISARQHFLRNVLKKEKVFLIGDQRELERMAAERLAD